MISVRIIFVNLLSLYNAAYIWQLFKLSLLARRTLTAVNTPLVGSEFEHSILFIIAAVITVLSDGVSVVVGIGVSVGVGVGVGVGVSVGVAVGITLLLIILNVVSSLAPETLSHFPRLEATILTSIG